jgi:hypothetical protein
MPFSRSLLRKTGVLSGQETLRFLVSASISRVVSGLLAAFKMEIIS